MTFFSNLYEAHTAWLVSHPNFVFILVWLVPIIIIGVALREHYLRQAFTRMQSTSKETRDRLVSVITRASSRLVDVFGVKVAVDPGDLEYVAIECKLLEAAIDRVIAAWENKKREVQWQRGSIMQSLEGTHHAITRQLVDPVDNWGLSDEAKAEAEKDIAAWVGHVCDRINAIYANLKRANAEELEKAPTRTLNGLIRRIVVVGDHRMAGTPTWNTWALRLDQARSSATDPTEDHREVVVELFLNLLSELVKVTTEQSERADEANNLDAAIDLLFKETMGRGLDRGTWSSKDAVNLTRDKLDELREIAHRRERILEALFQKTLVLAHRLKKGDFKDQDARNWASDFRIHATRDFVLALIQAGIEPDREVLDTYWKVSVQSVFQILKDMDQSDEDPFTFPIAWREAYAELLMAHEPKGPALTQIGPDPAPPGTEV